MPYGLSEIQAAHCAPFYPLAMMTLVVFVLNHPANRIKNLVDGCHCIGVIFGCDHRTLATNNEVQLNGELTLTLVANFRNRCLAILHVIVKALQCFKTLGNIGLSRSGTIDTMENNLEHIYLSFCC